MHFPLLFACFMLSSVMLPSPHTKASYRAVVCGQTLRQAFRFLSFLPDAAATSPSLAQPLSARHSHLVVRLLSHSLSPIPSNSTRTRPFVLTGPHLLRVTDNINPTRYVRRFLTAVLGMPIATAEREAADAQGLRVASCCSSTRTRTSTAPPAPRSFALATATFSARTSPSPTSSRELAHLPSTFDLPDSVDSSADSTRSRPASVTTEMTPKPWLLTSQGEAEERGPGGGGGGRGGRGG